MSRGRGTLMGVILIGIMGSMGCGGGAVTDAPDVESAELDGARTSTRINATDEERWVRFDFEAPQEQAPRDEEWDLAFRRQHVDLNDEAGVAIAIIDGRDLEQVEGRPAEDRFLEDTGDGEDELAFSLEDGWYDYSLLSHELTPKRRTYVVRSSEDILYKLQFTTYYDDQDRSRFPTFTWEVLEGDGVIEEPEPEECVVEETITDTIGDHAEPAEATLDAELDAEGRVTATLDASLGGAERAATSSYVYVNLERAELVELSDRASRSSSDWQLAFKRSEIRINSADSGPGQVAIWRDAGASFEQAAPPSPDAEGWEVDDFVDEDCEVAMIGPGGPGFLGTAFGQWYDYDFETHTLSAPEDVTYFVRDGDRGALYKLAITGYEDGVYSLVWEPTTR